MDTRNLSETLEQLIKTRNRYSGAEFAEYKKFVDAMEKGDKKAEDFHLGMQEYWEYACEEVDGMIQKIQVRLKENGVPIMHEEIELLSAQMEFL